MRRWSIPVCVGHPVAHSIAGGLRAKTIDACRSAEQPRDGMEWDLTGVRLAEGGEYLNIAVTSHRRNFVHETALADARRSGHADHSAVAIDRTVQQPLNGRHLPPPTHQIRHDTL